jgi:hypothetical protein
MAGGTIHLAGNKRNLSGRSNLVKEAIYVRFVLVLILLFLVACTSQAKSPTTIPNPIETQPATELPSTPAPTAIPPTETLTSVATSAPSPTQAVELFTESGGVYTVNLTPADFVDVIDNPYFPLPAGTKWEYEIRNGNNPTQTDTLEVLKEKRAVNGVQATVVRDTVSVPAPGTVSSGNQIVEDTFDWFAQDKYGNVWYVGESVDNYIGGILVSHAGSWEWGVDGALPGIIMWAEPSAHLNEEYRQEYYVGKAEDMGQVLSVTESLTVPFGSFDQVVKTLDFSNIETGKEQKFYAPGIGLLKEMDVNGKEEVVLIKLTQPTQ